MIQFSDLYPWGRSRQLLAQRHPLCILILNQIDIVVEQTPDDREDGPPIVRPWW